MNSRPTFPLLVVAAVTAVLTILTGAAAAVETPGPAASQISAVSARVPGTARFAVPLPGPVRVTRYFDPPRVPWGRGHRGIDLMAPVGTPVFAAGTGTVGYAGQLVDRGVLTIVHDDGLRTTYEPVETDLVVGAEVEVGSPIGVLAAGHRGCPGPACLHWGLRHGEAYLDPLLLLGDGRARLLPVGPMRAK